MTIVLKNNSNFKSKLTSLMDIITKGEDLFIIADRKFAEDIEIELTEMGFGMLKYMHEILYINKDTGLKVSLMKVDKYI